METLELTGELATAYLELGRNGPAESLQRDTVERLRRVAGPESPDTAGALSLLGLNLLKQKRYSDAEPVLRECLKIREEKLPDSWVRFNAMSMLGEALLGQKKYAEAEPLLLDGYEGMKLRQAKIPPFATIRLPMAIERLVKLCEATHRPETAKKWRKKLPREIAPAPRPVP